MKNQIPHMIHLWVKRVRKEIPGAKNLPVEKITQGLSDFLLALTEVTSINEPHESTDCFSYQNLQHARVYGLIRADIPGYTLDQVLIEFRILRAVIIGVLEEGGFLTHNRRDIILEFLDNGRTAAATEFALMRGFSDARLALEVKTELNDAQAEIKKLDFEQKARENFVSALSHDLRNPLSAAKMFAELISRDTSCSAVIQKYGTKISECIDRTDRMIRDLLDSNRIRSGETLPLQRSACDLAELFQSTLKDLSFVFGKRFSLHCDESVQANVDADAVRRIVENLITNAVKYGSPNSEVTLTLKTNPEGIEFSVHNEGNPISKLDQDTLFEQFRRSESAQSGKEKGWGIGLTLVRGIAESHGGKVIVHSAPEKGTTFTVTLPWNDPSQVKVPHVNLGLNH